MTELVVIFVIALLVLGPTRLPELARSLGRALAEFRRASTDLRQSFLDVSEEARVEPRPPRRRPSPPETETPKETSGEADPPDGETPSEPRGG